MKLYLKKIDEKEISRPKTCVKNCWVDIQNAKMEDLLEVVKIMKIDIADIDDALDINEIPRIEKIDDTSVMFFKMPVVVKDEIQLSNLTIILNKENLVTISTGDNPISDALLDKNCKTKFFTSQKSQLLILMLTMLAESYLKNIEKIRRKLHLNTVALEKIEDLKINELVKYEEHLNYLNLALQPTKYVVQKLMTGKFIEIFEDDEAMIQDMFDSINQAAEINMVNLRSIVTLRDSYKILLDIRLNKTIKVLTSITIIMTIPTIISSVYGMNVPIPEQNSEIHFFFILGLIAVSSLIALVIFYFKKWL